jgi:aspartate racemase
MGPRSTAPFIEMLITEFLRQTGARYDDDFPTITILSWPTPFYVDRPVDHALLEREILAGLKKLERDGADFIATPSSTAHMYYDSLAAGLHVPLIDMIEEAINFLPDNARKVGLLATRPAMEASIYQGRMVQRGYSTLNEDQWQLSVDDMIRAVKVARDPSLLKGRWMTLIEEMAEGGADCILVGCTDLSGLAALGPSPVPIVDASLALAGAVVRYWRLAE